MVRRKCKQRKRKAKLAVAKGDEPPDPLTIASLVGAGVAVAGAVTTPIMASRANKAAQVSSTSSSNPLVADTKLKPGEKVNLINTSPQGLLDSASIGRQTLLGG